MTIPLMNRLCVALKKIIPAVLLLGSLSLATAPVAHGQITINFVYNGTDTTSTFSIVGGSLSGVSGMGGPANSVGNISGGGYNSQPGFAGLSAYTIGAFTNSAWGSALTADSISGDIFRLQSGSMSLASSYDISTGGDLSGSMTWQGKSLTDLGFASNDAASGSFAAAGSTLSWTSTNSAVPEPSTYALVAGVLCLAVVVVRRRRSTVA